MCVIGDINGYQDAAISVRDCPNTQVLANTCIDPAATYMSAIEYRFTTSTGIVIENNITDNTILLRDGASATLLNNITDADDSTWYVNPGAGNLNLTASATPAFFAGLFPQPNVTNDWNGNSAPSEQRPGYWRRSVQRRQRHDQLRHDHPRHDHPRQHVRRSLRSHSHGEWGWQRGLRARRRRPGAARGPRPVRADLQASRMRPIGLPVAAARERFHIRFHAPRPWISERAVAQALARPQRTTP